MATKSATNPELFPKAKPLSIREEKITPQNIKALNWKQPFAYLMLPPHNKIETRTWNTDYRGLVLICASKVPYSYEDTGRISGYRQNSIYDITKGLTLINGHAIAVGRLDDTGFMEKDDEEKCFVQYRHGLYVHIYSEVVKIEPIPFKGSQGWGYVSQDVINKIKFV